MDVTLSLILIQVLSISLHLICLAAAWILTVVFIWKGWRVSRDGVAYVKRLHQIPCHRCAFFTQDYRLKCTVNPYKALTEDAIDCFDYEPIDPSRTCPCQQRMTEIFQKELAKN
jgi:hypothetical protein